MRLEGEGGKDVGKGRRMQLSDELADYSTSCAAALTTKIRFLETSEVSRRSGSVRG
jgi:hypothetical protein